MPPAWFIFLRIALPILGLLWFHIHFWIVQSTSEKKVLSWFSPRSHCQYPRDLRAHCPPWPQTISCLLQLGAPQLSRGPPSHKHRALSWVGGASWPLWDSWGGTDHEGDRPGQCLWTEQHPAGFRPGLTPPQDPGWAAGDQVHWALGMDPSLLCSGPRLSHSRHPTGLEPMPPNPTPVFLASSLCPMPMLLVPSFPPWLHRGGPAQGLPGVPRGLITSEDEAGRAAVDHHHLRQECPYTGEEREPGSFRGQAGRPQGSVWESQRAALSHCAHTPPHCLQQPTAAPFPQQATRWCSPPHSTPRDPGLSATWLHLRTSGQLRPRTAHVAPHRTPQQCFSSGWDSTPQSGNLQMPQVWAPSFGLQLTSRPWRLPFSLAFALLACFLGLPLASTPPAPHTPNTPCTKPPLTPMLLLTTCNTPP